jgi:hypothetical protein
MLEAELLVKLQRMFTLVRLSCSEKKSFYKTELNICHLFL